MKNPTIECHVSSPSNVYRTVSCDLEEQGKRKSRLMNFNRWPHPCLKPFPFYFADRHGFYFSSTRPRRQKKRKTLWESMQNEFFGLLSINPYKICLSSLSTNDSLLYSHSQLHFWMASKHDHSDSSSTHVRKVSGIFEFSLWWFALVSSVSLKKGCTERRIKFWIYWCQNLRDHRQTVSHPHFQR